MVALATFTASAQVGIGVPTANIDASAQLEVASTNKGFLAPRMSEAQKNNIASPAAGLLVYQTDGTAGFYYYDGSAWKSGLGAQGLKGEQGEQGPACTPADLSSYATTAALGQLETQVAQSTSDISALGSSLNEKAPIASPSFTGTVTVGGASSTSSAVVEVSSTTQGLLVPRLTNDQVNAISNPAEGLILYNTTTGKFMGFAKSTTTSSAPTIQQPLMSINEFRFGYREMSMGPEVEIMKDMLGQTFTLPNASTLNSIQLYLTNFAGGASSTVTVSVYSGELPQDYAAFDFSNPITSSSQTLSSTGYTTFNFTPLSLTAGKYYFILSCDNMNYACSGDPVVFTDTDSNGTSVNEYYFQTQYNGRQQYDYINYKSNSSYSLYFVLGLSGSTSETKNWKNLND